MVCSTPSMFSKYAWLGSYYSTECNHIIPNISRAMHGKLNVRSNSTVSLCESWKGKIKMFQDDKSSFVIWVGFKGGGILGVFSTIFNDDRNF